MCGAEIEGACFPVHCFHPESCLPSYSYKYCMPLHPLPANSQLLSGWHCGSSTSHVMGPRHALTCSSSAGPAQPCMNLNSTSPWHSSSMPRSLCLLKHQRRSSHAFHPTCQITYVCRLLMVHELPLTIAVLTCTVMHLKGLMSSAFQVCPMSFSRCCLVMMPAVVTSTTNSFLVGWSGISMTSTTSSPSASNKTCTHYTYTVVSVCKSDMV